MKLSTMARLLLAWAAPSYWRNHGHVDAMSLSSFPLYCSKDMERNVIASLADSVSSSFGDSVSPGDVQLLQVHALIRHGARGPFAKPQCWQGYEEQWDCNVTEVVSPSLSSEDGGVGVTGLFRKRYDAYPSRNSLDGTCAEGQLLDEGYEQERENGRHLRDAYVCDGPLCLFTNDSAAELQESGALYLRSDDQSRTAMSGQILTASLLNVSGAVLDWHTGDFANDYLAPNLDACPRLGNLSDAALSDPDWVKWTESFEVAKMDEDMKSLWGEEDIAWWDAYDCFMTSACTGRELPDEMTEALFEEYTSFAAKQFAQEALYHDSAYAKLAMAKLVLEVRERVEGAVNGTSPVKFALVSGHDTTLIPFMAAVAPAAWDQEWPPYAALATIEVLYVGAGLKVDEGYFFRFVYNGEVLRLEGCDQDVCAIDAFFEATQFSVDLRGGDHCCCLNATHLMDDPDDEAARGGELPLSSSSSSNNSTSVSPAPVDVTSAPLASPAGPASATGTPSTSNRSAGLSESRNIGAGGGTSDAGNTAIGVALACFVVGAIAGGVPAFLYLRRFRYEAMRGGGHSYEMT